MNKFFNTAGPVNRDQHYKLDPLSRWDMDDILALIEQEKYFTLHAPRQTGKTSSLLALRDYLNARDTYREIIPRELTMAQQDNFEAILQPEWVKPAGRIDSHKLITMFREFWRENSDIWGDQTADYARRSNADEAHLVIFDRAGRIDWKNAPLTESAQQDGQTITVWGLQ